LLKDAQTLYSADMDASGYIRIGELGRRVGVSPELLRAWERRYGLLQPERSPGGFRLYSDADVARVRAMRRHLGEGLSAAEAARLARETGLDDRVAVPDDGTPLLEGARGDLRAALLRFDEAAAHAALDRLLSGFALDTVLRDAVVPLLHELGEEWARGETTVGQEHFASQLLRGRLLSLGRGWDRGSGPRALLAAPPGELHDLGLVVFGLALRERGWRITFLGADTPLETLLETANDLAPDLIVLAAVRPAPFAGVHSGLRTLAGTWRLALGGAGASPDLAARVGAELLPEGPVDAADRAADLGRPLPR